MVLGEWPGGGDGGNSQLGRCGVPVRLAVGILAPGASLGDLCIYKDIVITMSLISLQIFHRYPL